MAVNRIWFIRLDVINMKLKVILLFEVLILISISVGFTMQNDIIENPDKYTEMPTLKEGIIHIVIFAFIGFILGIIVYLWNGY